MFLPLTFLEKKIVTELVRLKMTSTDNVWEFLDYKLVAEGGGSKSLKCCSFLSLDF